MILLHRAKRRRYSIIGMLADKGPQNGTDLAQLLGYLNQGSIIADLRWLENHSLINVTWSPGPAPRRRIYSLTEMQGRRLPPWVYAFVLAVDRYEDEHPKQEDCLGHELTTMVPAEVRRYARETWPHDMVTTDLQKRHIT